MGTGPINWLYSEQAFAVQPRTNHCTATDLLLYSKFGPSEPFMNSEVSRR